MTNLIRNKIQDDNMNMLRVVLVSPSRYVASAVSLSMIFY